MFSPRQAFDNSDDEISHKERRHDQISCLISPVGVSIKYK